MYRNEVPLTKDGEYIMYNIWITKGDGHVYRTLGIDLELERLFAQEVTFTEIGSWTVAHEKVSFPIEDIPKFTRVK